MIPVGRYGKEIEEAYWACVDKTIERSEQQEIIASCKKYLPPDFFPRNASLEKLVLAPYKEIKRAYEYIEKDKSRMEAEYYQYREGKKEKTRMYEMLYGSYEAVFRKTIEGKKVSVFLVEQAGLTVCPYCNRDYINSRSEKIAGAQMDHFYPRSFYPVFAVCLYNLVPVCGNCNRIKSDHAQALASPFDGEIDWEGSLHFSFELRNGDQKKIVIKAEDPVKKNIEVMRIEEAYQIHGVEVSELLDKVQAYSRTQQEELRQVLGKAELTEQDIRKMVFGSRITQERMKKKPLGRMLRDLEQELGIYD